MMIRLIFLFSFIPLIELLLLIKVGSFIGAMNTVLVVIVTAAVGAALAKKQGADTIWRIRESLKMGHFPADNLLDGLLIFSAALFLITPGILTDMCGFLLLIPATRTLVKRQLGHRFRNWMDHRSGSIHIRL